MTHNENIDDLNREQLRVEIEHRKKNPLLGITRLHASMPTLITASLLLTFLVLVMACLMQFKTDQALDIISGFLNRLPKEAWTLLNIIFAFWFAGKAGSELIQSYKNNSDK